MQKIYILMSGLKGDCQGYPEAAFKSKSDLRKYIKTNHPDSKGTNRMYKDELYWECEIGWLRCDDEILFLQGSECTVPVDQLKCQ